jgi:tetratricopeptide (TPR) repeat protein
MITKYSKTLKTIATGLFFLLTNHQTVLSQKAEAAKEGILTIELQIIKEEDMPFSGVTCKIYEKGVLSNTILSDSEGILKINLKDNSEFLIEITHKDYFTKKIEVNTVFPKNEKKTFQPGLTMSFYKPCPGLDLSELNEPVAKVSYNEKRREFMQDKDYEKIALKKLELLGEKNNKCIDENVQKANTLFDEKKYLDARALYVKAVEITPLNQFAIDRIAEIDRLLANDKSKDKLYNDYIAQGDKQFASKSYVMAKEYYRRALAFKASEKYPAAQIEAIDKLMADKNKQAQEKQTQEAKYQDLISQGTIAMTDDVCGKALQLFKDALVVKPNDPTAKLKLSEAEKKCTEIQAKASQDKDKVAKLANAISKADALFKENKLNEAKKAYQDALIISPTADIAQKQISVIDDKLKQQAKEADAFYKSLIDAADKAFDDKKITAAKESYQKALALKPTDTYVQNQIKLIDSQIAEQQKKDSQNKELEAKYNAAITNADALYKANKFNEAKKIYQDAQAIKPSSEYAQNQITAIDDMVKKQAKDFETAYKAIVDAADEALDAKNLALAKENYQKAIVLRPTDTYVQNQIKQTDNLIAEQQKKDQLNKTNQNAYNAAIAEADKLFTAKDYTKARESYNKASTILANEEYPKQKIKEIDNTLKAKDKEQEQEYKASIKAGDKALDDENFTTALELFKKAVAIKPADAFATEQIKTIENLIAEQKKNEAEKKAKQELYNKAIADADLEFKKPNYKTAAEGYKKALQILPTESYPKQKLSEIDAFEKELAEKLELDYAAKIRSGDRNFATKNYTQAKQDYADALKLKTTETYPTQRISDIDKVLQEQVRIASEQKAKQDSYTAAIAKADNMLKSKQFDQAIAAYKEASVIKPDEKYPFTKVEEILQTKKNIDTENKYKQAITSADAFFAKKQFEQAKSFYAQAINLKANDSYATKQIALADKEINDQLKLLADQKSRQEAFDKSILEGDKAFTAKDYEMAKANYQKALAIFPDKPAPKQKISDIDKILKEFNRNEEYNAILNEANALFTAKNFDQAKIKYKAALVVKPEEIVPTEKIKSIDQMLAQQLADKQKKEQTEQSYNESLNKANDLFEKAQYDAAKKEYENALTFMPNEVYPKQKLARINEIKKLLAADKAATDKSKSKPVSDTKIADLKFKNNSEREQYTKELLAKYPPGVTCEVYKEKSRTITRYIIIRENVAFDYREVKFNWGGVDYYRNDKPITLMYFNTQIKTREGEYFSKTEM